MKSRTEPAEAKVTENLFAGGGEMGKLMRSLDWTATPLGPVENWPQSLRTTLSICLASRFPMSIWWGTDLVELYNDAYRPMLGRTKHPRSLGQCGRDVWPEIWDIIGPMLEGVLYKGEATWSDDLLLLLDRNGYLEECYFTFSYSPIRDESGGVGGVFTAVTETTQRVLRERRLLSVRDLAAIASVAQTAEQAGSLALQTLASNTADIPFALLYLLDANGQTARLAGTTGLNSDIPAPPELIDLTQPEEKKITNFSFLTSQFSFLPSSPLILPVAQPGDRPAGILVIGISPRRVLDEDYRSFLELVALGFATAIGNARAYEAQKQRAEQKTTFLSNISHEFRTPLTLILGPVEEILADTENALSPGVRSQLDLIHRNSLRLLKLVNTLLDFSRIEAGKVEAVCEPTDLAAFTAELASVFRSAIERVGLRLLVNCPPLSEPTYTDRQMWEKIVLNLLSNALKFTFEGEIEVSLSLENSMDKGELVIGNGFLSHSPIPKFAVLKVRDTGIGISSEELPHLFERFHRVRYARSRTHEGTGIGLALVQELVKLHGGTVEVTSAIGVGTTFKICIPTGISHIKGDRIAATRTLASTALAATPYLEEALGWLSAEGGIFELGMLSVESKQSDRSSSSSTPHSSLNNQHSPSARILLADNNADMRNYVKRLLEQHYQVEAVADGTLALAAALNSAPDLILSDVMMPGLDGFELLRQLRANPQTREIPIILLSARAGEESRIEGHEGGADDYLIKPFSARELLARVRSNLEMAKLRSEATRREQVLRADAEAAQKKIINILENITDAFFAVDKDWRYTYVNKQAEKLVKKNREELIGTHLWKIFPEAVNLSFYTEAQRAVSEKNAVHFEAFFPPLNTWFESHFYPSQEGLSIFARDISDRKRAEEELHKERDFIATVLNTIASLVVVLDRQGRIVSFNRACEKTTGYSFEEVKGAYVWDLFLISEELQPVRSSFENMRVGNFTSEYENYWLTKDGSRRLIAWSNTVLLDECGEVEFVIGTGIDITDRRQTEVALEQSEAKFRHLAESNLIGVIFVDFNGRIIEANDAFLQMVGYAPEDLRSPGLRWDTMTPPEYRALDEEKIQQIKASAASPAWEKEYIRKDGTRVPILIGAALLPDSRENCVCFVLDLTERKQAEEALRFALQKLNFHVENTPLAVIEWNREFQVSRWSLSAKKLFGWEPQEVLGKHPLEWPSSSNSSENFSRNELISPSSIGLYPSELQVVAAKRNYAKNGSIIDCEWYNSALLDEQGNLVSVLSLVLDVTERQAALSALQQSKERFRIAAESASDLIYEWDIRSECVEWFGNLDEQLGYGAGELSKTSNFWQTIIHPDDRDRVLAAVERHLKTRQPFFEEYRVRRRDGTVLYWTDRGTAIWDENGNPYKWIGAATDITAQQLDREEILKLNLTLERRVAELQTLLEVIPVGIAIAEDAECHCIRVNPTLAKLLGISADANATLGATAEQIPSSYKIYKDGLQLPLDELPMRYAVRHGIEVINMELDIVREDGKIVKILESAAPLFDEEGKARGCVGATLDITERKQTEEALRLSEERYRSLAESLPDMVCLITPQGIIDYCNQSWFDYTGLTLEQTQNLVVQEVIHPDDRAIATAMWKNALQTGNSFSWEFRIRKTDGVYRWHVARGRPIKADDGRVVAWLAIASDIDDQKRAQEVERFLADVSNLLAHSLEYQTTIDSVARLVVPRIADWCAIDVLQADGSVHMLTLAHVDEVKVALARSPERRYPPKLNINWGMPKVLRTGMSEVYAEIPESWLVQASHNAEHLQFLRELGMKSAIFVPLKARGRTLGAISFVLKNGDRHYEGSDLALAEALAHRAALAIDNARLYGEAQDANRLKDEFLATLSHELRTPMNAILGWAQILRSRKLNEQKILKALETIERNARSQNQLIGDLLDVSRIITGKLRLDIQPVELGSAIEAALDSIRPAADAKCIQLVAAIDWGLMVWGDRDRLQQIVWNLLSNAIKFTPPGGTVAIAIAGINSSLPEDLKLDTSLTEDNNFKYLAKSKQKTINSYVEIRVSDTGIGINAEFLPFVFERFRQADGSRTKSYNGLGLGLAIVRHLTELHGGIVSVESAGEGQGATFTVQLPIRQQESGNIKNEEINAFVPSSFIGDPTLAGLQILVVDDDADTREFVSTVLEESGAVVITAASVGEAIAAIKLSKPDVLIGDIAMPYEDGYSLIRRIRAIEAECGGFLPAAALTAYAREEDRTRALLAGFQLHLPKPVDAAELVAVVANLTRRTGRFQDC